MAQLQCVCSNNNPAGTTVQVTLSNVVSGSELLAFVASSSQGTMTSIADDVNGTWTKSSADSDGTAMHSWYFLNSASATTMVVTATFNNSAELCMAAIERDDITGFDVQAAQATHVGVTTPWSLTSNTTPSMSQNRCLAYGLFGTADGQGAFGNAECIGSGWTAVTGTGLTNGYHGSITGDSTLFEEREYTAGGTSTATATGLRDLAGFSNVFVYKLLSDSKKLMTLGVG